MARGAADNQYREDEVIVDTIPDKKLADTGGPPFVSLAGVALLGRSVTRRAL